MVTVRMTQALIVGLSAVLALSSCGSTDSEPAPGSDPASPSTATTEPAADPYTCRERIIPSSVVDDPPGLKHLSPAGREAVDSAYFDDSMPLVIAAKESWSLASEREDEIVLIRPLPAERLTHELLSIEHITDASNLAPGWYVTSRGSCSLFVDLGGLHGADVTLDPDNPLAPDSPEIALLVTEQACNSGEDAEGRVETVEVIETDTEVRVIVGVRPRNVAATCPGHPATLHVVTLDAPLGDRTVIDAAVVPEQKLG